MLSGLKFIPRDQLDDKTQDDKSDSRKSNKKKKNKSRDDGSSDEDGSQRIKKRSKKKWYSSEEDDSDSYSDSGSEEDMRKGKESKKRHKSKKSRRRGKSKRRGYSSDESDDDDDDDKKKKGKKKSDKSDIDGNSGSMNDNENIVRKEMGLEWMLRPKEEDVKQKSVPASSLPEEPPANEIKKVNPRELNPYFRNDGSGYPEEEADGAKSRDSNLLSTSIVGDGGASWRLKAMKRSQEQAARERKYVDEVLKERWGSLGELAVSVASTSAAPSHAHLHAIKNRIRQENRDQQGDQNTQDDKSVPACHLQEEPHAKEVFNRLIYDDARQRLAGAGA